MDCVPIQWPGERTTARHELEPDSRIQNWFGGLVDDMRDASGQMYRRNRYYDPQTGQFTQPDPIGLAGGLNAYGFADGDPVSYSDPYGLCSVKLMQKDGTCPGGLNHVQYRYVENVARQNMKPEAGSSIVYMLENSLISAGEMTNPIAIAETDHVWDDFSRIRLSASFFQSEHPGDAAHVLGHELGHVIQRQVLGFTSGGDFPMSQIEWFEVTRQPNDGAFGSVYFKAQQADADRYGCSVAIGMVYTRMICQ